MSMDLKALLNMSSPYSSALIGGGLDFGKVKQANPPLKHTLVKMQDQSLHIFSGEVGYELATQLEEYLETAKAAWERESRRDGYAVRIYATDTATAVYIKLAWGSAQ